MKKTILTSLFVFLVFLSSELFAESVGIEKAQKEDCHNCKKYMDEHKLFIKSPKKILREHKFKEWEQEKKEIVPVIINLNISSDDAGTDIFSGMPIKDRIITQQDRLAEKVLKNKNVKIRRIFENIPAFSCEIPIEILNDLVTDPRVDSIEPIEKSHLMTTQGISLIGANVYRSQYTGKGVSGVSEAVSVAVIDTGIDYSHYLLGDGFWGSSADKVKGGYDFAESDGDPTDPDGHGTSCAGIIAGEIDGGTTHNDGYEDYIGGVAIDAQLYALKVFPDSGGGAERDDIIAAIDWCTTQHGIDPSLHVISLSLGTDTRYGNFCDNDYPSYFNSVNAAYNVGITLVAASGNDGDTAGISAPACLSNVISVGAVYDDDIGSYWGSCSDIDTSSDMVTCYSNSAPIIDLLAPSNNATTTGNTGGLNYGFVLNFGGTSAACPYVAGAIAVIQEASYSLTGRKRLPNEIRSILTSTGTPITDNRNGINRTTPRINLEKAIQTMMYKLTPVAGSYGTISPSSEVYVEPGGTKTFYANPGTGYIVDKWYINGSLVQGSDGWGFLELSNIQANITVLVTFKIDNSSSGDLIVDRPAVNPYETGDSSVMCSGTAPSNTYIVRWENTTTGNSGNTGDPPGTTWAERISLDMGSNSIVFRAYDDSDNLLDSVSITVIRVNNIRQADGSNQRNCWISSGHSNFHGTGITFVGYDLDGGYYNERGLVIFDLPSLPFGWTSINNAIFGAKTTSGDHTGGGAMGLTIRRITGSWNEPSVTWNSQPGYTTSGQTTQNVGNVNNQWFYWDVTSIAQSWYGGSNNYGLFMISQSENNGSNLERVFRNSEYRLTIQYSIETQVPLIQITSPTSDPSYTTGMSSIALAGTASDNYQISYVDYRNQTTGASGTASGTNSWSCTVPLTAGSNTISVIAYDMCGNADSDTITVFYLTPPTMVTATDDIMDYVFIQWEPVIGAGYYRVYRSGSETGMKLAVSSWTDGLSFVDSTAVSGVAYYYWVTAAADISGTGESEFAGPAIGKRPALPNPDITGDGKVNFADFAVLASQWLGTGCQESNAWCDKADIDHSGAVGFDDILIMAENWLNGTGNMEEGLVAYWGFDDGTAMDNSGNGHDGSVLGAVPTGGVSGSALSFDGINDYVSIPYSSEFAYTIGQDNVTISAWVYPCDKDNIEHGAIYFDRAVGNDVVAIYMTINQGNFTLGGWSPTDTGYDVPNVTVPSNNQWYFMTAVFNSIEAKLYINGNLESSAPLVGVSLTNGGTGMIIGKAQGGYWENYFNGKIDEVRIYNSELSPSEIIALYNLSGPTDIVWVPINDPGVSGHEGFTGEMSKYETTNTQYCQFLNASLASGDITVGTDNIVYGANGSNSGADFVGQVYYNLAGAGYSNDGAINGGAARINYTGSSFTVDSDFENHPVTHVSWYGSTAFCNYYGWRLPTEWEWQAVADHDGSFNYGCGININTSIANYYHSIHLDGTTVGGHFGTYGYGMCDMAGNVWEWTSSIYSGSDRVVRGGTWGSLNEVCTVSDKTHCDHPYRTTHYIGFRICR